MKNTVILGSTGSIGTQALDVIDNSTSFRAYALAAKSNVKLLAEQIRKYKPFAACIVDEDKYSELKLAVADTDTRIVSGAEGLGSLASLDGADIVLNSVVGMAGLIPTLSAIESKKTVALANKETLVCAGEIVMRRAKENGVEILPVDSDHSDIFQCLKNEKKEKIKRIILTASGGPFFGKKKNELENITKKEALKHPNWVMGQKITIDSATLMNKGLEVIEAKWLFDIDADRIQVVVHPQSIVHSAVQFQDGAVKAQLGAPDMRVPIQLAMSYPVRLESSFPRIDWWDMQDLTFERPDMERFPCLAMAYEAIRQGGNAACVVNAANEVVNLAFRQDKCGFLQMADIITETLARVPHIKEPSLEDYLETDRIARIKATELL